MFRPKTILNIGPVLLTENFKVINRTFVVKITCITIQIYSDESFQNHHYRKKNI